MNVTATNTSKEVSAFSDFPAPEHFPNYMRHRQFLEYLQLYAAHHDLLKHVRLGHTVLQVQRAPDYRESGRWTVQYKDSAGIQSEEEFDCVLLAIGCNSTPNFPDDTTEWWPNQRRFRGRISHSKHYKHNAGFENKVCVVVGSANSALDVACDLSSVAAKVYLTCRRGAYVVGRVADYGRPIDLGFLTRFRTYFVNQFAPRWFLEWLMKRMFMRRFDHALYGLMPNESVASAPIYLSDELPSRIMTGSVVVKPVIREFTETGVIWADGTRTEPVDAVFLATGYKMRFDVLENGRLVPTDGDFARLYKNMYPMNEDCLQHNTLAFVGLTHVLASAIGVSEMQARYFFHQQASRSKQKPRGLLPEAEQMADEVNGRKMLFDARNGLRPYWLEIIPYMDSLAEFIGCKPNLRELFLKDPLLGKTVLFGPNCNYVYRLSGPHSWEGARDAIISVEDRVRRPFLTRTCAKGSATCSKD
ncbi:Protein FMO-5 [Aphelenchoides avenae]|nr:Protein FMO-5 [Aphelenchus avenae]